MFGIVDENKKFILLDSDHDRLRTTALILAHEETVVVVDYDEEGNKIGQHEETRFAPTYTEETVDEAIAEYAEEEIETAYNGEKYLQGSAPAIDNEYQSAQREHAYAAEVDTITAHINRLRDEGQTPEVQEKIAKLIEERKAKVAKIKQRYPYSTGE